MDRASTRRPLPRPVHRHAETPVRPLPRTHFTLLGLGERCAAALSDLKTGIVKPYLIGPGGLIDDAGHVAHAYGQDSLILIRPDGYIGLIADADNALAVADYLRALSTIRAQPCGGRA